VTLVVTVAAAVPAWAITEGEVDSENQYSNVCAIMVPPWPEPDSGQWMFVCTGTLIHPRVVLTAGHCTEWLAGWWNAPPEKVRVSFSPNARDEKEWLEVETYMTHPDYVPGWSYSGQGSSNPRDLGVVILKKPVKKIQPATLPEPFLLDLLKATGVLGHGPDGGTPLTVAGYGTTLDWPPPQHAAHDGLRRFAVTEYQALTNAWVMVSQSMANDNGGGGYGDSGGPTFWTDPVTEEQILIGITSWGDRNCLAIGFQYRTDIPDALDFIDLVLTAVGAGEL
jgi:secreted trypsin-like serine protease